MSSGAWIKHLAILITKGSSQPTIASPYVQEAEDEVMGGVLESIHSRVEASRRSRRAGDGCLLLLHWHRRGAHLASHHELQQSFPQPGHGRGAVQVAGEQGSPQEHSCQLRGSWHGICLGVCGKKA